MLRGLRRASLGLLVIVSLGVLSGGAGAADGLGGRITSVAGTGIASLTGDGGPAAAARIDHPRGLALLPDGGLLFVDAFRNVVRKITPDGTITIVAGNRRNSFSGDGGPATQAAMNLPHAVSVMADGSFLIADTRNQRIRRVGPDGVISTVAGSGNRGGFGGDGGAATAARLNGPRSVAATSDGGFLIADSDNRRVRKVSKDGIITTVAGSGAPGFSGDGGPAVAAALGAFAVASLPDGGFLVVDAGNQRIRRVSGAGIITTVAGNGVAGFAGDGGPATAASLNNPHNVFPLADGGFLIADTGNHRIRRVDENGVITTVAGNGTAAFRGDGGPASAAALNNPKAVAATPQGGILIADSENHRLRYVGSNSQPYFVRLRLSLSARGTRAHRPVVVTTTLSTWAELQIRIRRGKQNFGWANAHGRPGLNLVPVRTRLARGTYVLTGSARSLDGQVVRVTKKLKIVR